MADASELAPGTLLGPYRVLGRLGSGGMAEVMLAQDLREPWQPQVAIKVVRRALASPNFNARLKTEQKILARLHHPNIARFLDRGTTASGAPFIVMEYVPGEAIDTYCDRLRLPLEQRLRMFVNVCAAVHEAHLIRIVHRDLKPQNILVTAAGVPKLLDFGIAKMLDDRQTLQTLAITQVGFRLLTPEYASPEQVRSEPVTPASDIFVLGILLYELLSGCRPFELRDATAVEAEHIICEQAIMPPSAALGRPDAVRGRHEESPQERVAAHRSLTFPQLRQRLRGDLDAIVMTALQRDPQSRYPTAALLARDIERHLHGRPIRAPGWRGEEGVRGWMRSIGRALGLVKG